MEMFTKHRSARKKSRILKVKKEQVKMKKSYKSTNKDRNVVAIIVLVIVAVCGIISSCDSEVKAKEPQLYFDVPLEVEVQNHIFKVCEEYGVEPEIVVAMIDRESEFKASSIGDNGTSYGLMQVRPRYHTPRMKELNCTDLLNPKQNITVAVDYLAKCIEKNGDLEKALIAYNAGQTGAEERFFSKGIYSNAYSQDVLDKAEKYRKGMTEMFYTDDPVKDYDSYDAEQTTKFKQYPLCSYCCDPIIDDYLYEFNDELICEDCLNEHFRKPVDDYVE